MSEHWNALLPAALVGTERAELPPVKGADALSSALSRLEGQGKEERLLAASALLTQYRRAGATLPSSAIPPLSPAPPETLPVVGRAAAWQLEQVLSGEHRALLPEWLERCNRAGKRVPKRLIPELLEAGRGNTLLRDAVLSAVGERGRWLATLNRAWKYALPVETGEDDALWLEGTLPTRTEVFERTRRADPTKARAWLEETWKGEAGEAREAFVPLLAHSLSPEDEGLLEKALEDRRGAVRASAADLLARLPDSGYAQRMRARLEGVLVWNAGKLLVFLPREFDKAMQKDGFEKKPGYGVGERTWWMRQMLERVPLSHLSERFGVRPLELLKALSGHELEEDVLSGLKASLLRFSGPLEWADALAQNYGRAKKNAPILQLHEYLQFVPEAERERFVLERLGKHSSKVESGGSPIYLFSQLPRPWSDALSGAFLQAVREYLGRTGRQNNYRPEDYQMRSQFDAALERMHPDFALPLLEGWPDDDKLPYVWQGVLGGARRTLGFRREMARELSG